MLCKRKVLCKCDLFIVLPLKHSFSQPVTIECPLLRSDKPLFEAGACFVHVGVYVCELLQHIFIKQPPSALSEGKS